MKKPVMPPSRWLLLLSMVLMQVTACRSTRSTRSSTAREDFAPFYARFLTDSAFQMERTRFPLPGQKFTEEVADSAHRWQRADWRMLREPQLDSAYFSRNLIVSDTLVTDEITGVNSGFYFRMEYRPVDKKWHLVRMVDRDL